MTWTQEKKQAGKVALAIYSHHLVAATGITASVMLVAIPEATAAAARQYFNLQNYVQTALYP